jgi:hypothetical protein
VCNDGWLGQSCQIPVQTIEVGSSLNLSIAPNGNAYAVLQRPAGTELPVSLFVEVTDPASVSEFPMVYGFVRRGSPPSTFPRDYDDAALVPSNVTVIFPPTEGSAIDGLLLHNSQGWTAVYSVRTEFVGSTQTASPDPTESVEPSQSASPDPESKTGIIIGAVVGSTAFVIIIVIIVCCLYRRWKQKGQGDWKSELQSAALTS